MICMKKLRFSYCPTNSPSNHLGPVPERLISAYPGLKFHSIFVFIFTFLCIA